MLLSHCPNCQHDNPPGERFCAACGVPLDLKPCPVCGKVDSIKATVCSGCGAHFPALPGVLTAESGTPDKPHAKPTPSVVTPPPSTMRALPLIVVALAAGGIPLLWLYRNTMPVPKAWQAPAGSQATVPAPAPTPIPPPVKLEPVPPAQPPKAAPPPVVEQVPPPPPPKPAVKAAAPARPATRTAAKTTPEPPPAQPAKAGQGTECTEALAAVGLCDPKAGK